MAGKIMEKAKENGKKYNVPALDTAFKILDLLSQQRYRESTLTEISNALSLSASACFRILYTLEELSLVNLNKQTKQYTLGPALVVLGERAKQNFDYIQLCKPYLQSVRDQTGLTTVLVQKIRRDTVIYMDKVDGGDYSVNVSIGNKYNITNGSFGKCFLAYSDKAGLDYIIKNNESFKDKSELEMNQLLQELEEVKKNGYAISYGEQIKGIFGVAAPIFNKNNEMILVLSSFGLTSIIPRKELDSIAAIIKTTANEISKKLVY